MPRLWTKPFVGPLAPICLCFPCALCFPKSNCRDQAWLLYYGRTQDWPWLHIQKKGPTDAMGRGEWWVKRLMLGISWRKSIPYPPGDQVVGGVCKASHKSQWWFGAEVCHGIRLKCPSTSKYQQAAHFVQQKRHADWGFNPTDGPRYQIGSWTETETHIGTAQNDQPFEKNGL
jgi:hypothetical protein